MSNHEDSTRTPQAKAEAIARKNVRLTRYAAKRETDAALRAMMRPYQPRRLA